MDERTPVVVGVAQWTGRDPDPHRAPNPLDVLERVARGAAEDAGAGAALLRRLERVALVGSLSWTPRNPVRLLAERLGLASVEEQTTPIGGNLPQQLVNVTAQAIREGRLGAALLAGVELLETRRRARQAGVSLGWPEGGEGEPTQIGDARPGTNELENAHGIGLPAAVYPLFENALRARHGWSIEEHRRRIAELLSPFTDVAAANPYAWFPKRRSADEIARVAPGNRMVAFPYTKYMNAVIRVDQAAAVIVTSRAVARALGVPDGRLIWIRGGGDALAVPWFVSERPDLARSRALAAAAEAALAQAGVEIGEIDLFDLYSCFPCAVRIACEELGIPDGDPRPLTVTGGLPYAGGPGNNYSMHAIATLTERLRARPGATGLVTALGWYLSKHAAGVYASAPPAEPPCAVPSPTPTAATEPTVPLARDAVAGPGRIETYTVVYDRAGAPVRGLVLGRLDDERRFVANLPSDPDLLETLGREEGIGRRGRLVPGSPTNRFDLR